MQMKKKETRKGEVEEFHSLQISAGLFSVANNITICCNKMSRSFGRGYKLLTRHNLGVFSIAFVVAVVSVPVQGIFPVLFMKKHLS